MQDHEQHDTAEAPCCQDHYCPPCRCVDCLTSYFTREEQALDEFRYKQSLSRAQAQAILKQHLTQMQADRQFLREKCEAHGDRITSRWRKRSRDKREAWLLQAEPALPRQRWFVPRVMYSSSTDGWKAARKQRTGFLLAYLSVDLLKTDPAIFLGLLHNRTFFAPQDWAPFDNNELAISWNHGMYDCDFCRCCVVMHGSRYGQTVPWNPDGMHRADMLGFPRARIVFERQAAILRLLRKVVEQILTGAQTDSSTGSAKWTELTRTGFKKSGDVAYWSQFTNRTFSNPPKFNIDALISLAKASKDAATDHLWLLQTEPAYIRRCFQLIRQNSPVGKNSPRGRTNISSSWQGELDLHALRYYVCIVWTWQTIQSELENAKLWHDQHENQIRNGEPLPQEYDTALGALEARLSGMLGVEARNLARVIPQRPGFHHLFGDDPASKLVKRKSNLTVSGAFFDDPLDWCLLQLQEMPGSIIRFNYEMLFEFLDDHLVTSPSNERARVDEVILNRLSEYVAFAELYTAIRLHRPQSKRRDLDDVIKDDVRNASRQLDDLLGLELPYRRGLRASLDKFLKMPLLTGRKNKQWLENFDSTHKALGDFWSSMAEEFQYAYAKAHPKAGNVAEALAILRVRDSQDHLDAFRRERESIVEEIRRAAKPLDVEYQQFDSETTFTAKETYKPLQKKVKVKTRPHEPVEANADTTFLFDGQHNNPPNDNQHNVQPDNSQQQNQTITVKHRTFNVFAGMFPASSAEGGKSVDWDTFIHAMAEAGFVASQTGGSAVAFENKESESFARGKIVFHKPHPVAKIDPVMLHSMGRRMNKRFGWQRGLFALEKPPH